MTRGMLIGLVLVLAVAGTAVATMGGGNPPSHEMRVDRPEIPDPATVTPVREPNRVGVLNERLIEDCLTGELAEAGVPLADIRDLCGMQLGLQQGVFRVGQELSNAELRSGLEQVEFPDGIKESGQP